MKYIILITGLMLCIYNTHAQTADSAKAALVYTYVEHMPKYNGGDDSLFSFIANNIHYPKKARKHGIYGKVYVQFIVNEDGSLSNFTILRDIGYGCGDEGVRVLKSMPRWEPGKQNGKAVRVSFILPIKFTLPDKKG